MYCSEKIFHTKNIIFLSGNGTQSDGHVPNSRDREGFARKAGEIYREPFVAEWVITERKRTGIFRKFSGPWAALASNNKESPGFIR